MTESTLLDLLLLKSNLKYLLLLVLSVLENQENVRINKKVT